MLVARGNGLRLHQRGLRFFREFVQVHKPFNKSTILHCVTVELGLIF
jgi:hypothetical protein